MPFGPTNAPIFYSAMMKDFKIEWDILFTIRVLDLKLLNNESISLQGSEIILIGVKPLVWDSRTIIDHILLWCDIKECLPIYFCCVCEVFKNTESPFD